MKVGGVQDRLMEVEVKGLTSGLLGGSGGLITVTLAEDETSPFLLATVHVYVPSSSLSTICILRTQLSSPRLVNARSMFSGRPSLLHSTTGGGFTSLSIIHLSITERSAITVSSESGLTIHGACSEMKEALYQQKSSLPTKLTGIWLYYAHCQEQIS